jgi:hypothetical protein
LYAGPDSGSASICFGTLLCAFQAFNLNPRELIKLVSMKSTALKVIISVVCLVLLLVHSVIRSVDLVALGIVAIGILPWLSELIGSAESGGYKFQFRQIKQEQERLAEELARLLALVPLVVPDCERTYLRKLAAQEPFLADVRPDSTFRWELSHLLSLRFIDGYPGKGIRTLFSQDGQRDVKDHLFITERGREYLHILESPLS